MGAAVPCRHSLDSDRLLGRSPRPPSWWACTNPGCHPPQAHFRQRPLRGKDSQSPQLVGARRRGLPHPTGALWAATASWARLPVPPAGGPALMGAAVPRGCSLDSDRLLGRTPRPPSSWARALHEFHCPPPPGSVAVHCRSSVFRQ